MAFSFARVKTWSAGDTLTAAELNGEFDNIIANATPASIGAQTLDATLTALAALTLSQGCLITATAADAPLVLAKGAANTHLMTNAGATAPEFAVPYKIGTFTRAMDAAGAPTDVAYTSVGFKPSVVVFLSALDTKSMSVGLSNATLNYSVTSITSTSYGGSAAACIAIYEDGSKNQTAIVKTLDADGFTLTWTKGSTPASATANIYYLALR